MTYIESFYAGVVTLTTVGFGDCTPKTHGGRLFAMVWMIVGVAAFANLAARFTRILMPRRHVKELSPDMLESIMDDPLTKKCISEDDHSFDKSSGVHGCREGVNRAEFILYMLMKNGLVDANVVYELCGDFSQIDSDKNGILQEDDVKVFKTGTDEVPSL